MDALERRQHRFKNSVEWPAASRQMREPIRLKSRSEPDSTEYTAQLSGVPFFYTQLQNVVEVSVEMALRSTEGWHEIEREET